MKLLTHKLSKRFISFKGALYTCGIAIVNGIIQTISDLQFIHQDQHSTYLIGRSCFILLMFIPFVRIWITKKAMILDIVFLFFIVIGYCVFSQFYNPSYFIGYIQSIVILTLFFPTTAFIYNCILFSSMTVMVLAMNLSSAFYPSIEKFKQDEISSIVVITLLCFFGYRFIIKQRIEKDILSEKFLDAGRYFGNFVHDLKGSLSSPNIYLELIKKELNSTSPNFIQLNTIVNNLSEDINKLNEKIYNINVLSKNDNSLSSINVKEMIESIKKLIFNKNKMEINCLGKEFVFTNEFSLRSILINLINNSKENFQIKKIIDPKIIIEISNNSLTYKDNGGGFSPNALKKINSNSSFFSEKPQGTGIGLYMVKKYMEEHGGNVKFSNTINESIKGVQIELIFKGES